MRIRGTVLALALLAGMPLCAQEKSVQAASESKEQNIRAYIELLRADLKSKKAEVITEVMQFNDGQATAFWPLYREYDLELSKLGDEKLSIIQEYAANYLSMTDEKADHLAGRVMALDDRKMELRKKFYPRFKTALGAVMAVRFFQVENQIHLVLDLQIASGLPIIEETGKN